jgi:hypothetical protein
LADLAKNEGELGAMLATTRMLNILRNEARILEPARLADLPHRLRRQVETGLTLNEGWLVLTEYKSLADQLRAVWFGILVRCDEFMDQLQSPTPRTQSSSGIFPLDAEDSAKTTLVAGPLNHEGWIPPLGLDPAAPGHRSECEQANNKLYIDGALPSPFTPDAIHFLELVLKHWRENHPDEVILGSLNIQLPEHELFPGTHDIHACSVRLWKDRGVAIEIEQQIAGNRDCFQNALLVARSDENFAEALAGLIDQAS